MTIEMQQPRAFDLVSDKIQIAGQAVTFEANIQWRVDLGPVDATGFFMGGGGVSVLQFQETIDVNGLGIHPYPGPAHLTLFAESPADGAIVDATTVQVILAERLFSDYQGWQPYTIQAGDTLSAIAADRYGDPSAFGHIQAANAHIIANPNQIFPGMQIRIPLGTPIPPN